MAARSVMIENMAAMKESLASELECSRYQFDTGQIITPALVIYPEIVKDNITRTIDAVGGDPSRWRPHLKTAKIGTVIEMLVEASVTTAKCATTLELLTACESGMKDVLVAYAHVGANAGRLAAIAASFPDVKVSVLVDAAAEIEQWRGTAVSLFVDINPGMDRTGMDSECVEDIARLASKITGAGLSFRGLHFYDGNSTEADLAVRTARAHERYTQLMELITRLEGRGIEVREVITSGTPALPCALAFPALWQSKFRHQVSPGTVVYNDASSLSQLPEEYNLAPAALVISRVISHPKADVFTCDAGHKSVSVDSGVPHCLFLGHPEFAATKPSEEHLPCKVTENSQLPPIGAVLYLIPRHVCPTVNNFDKAAFVGANKIHSVEEVTARGREGPVATSHSREPQPANA